MPGEVVNLLFALYDCDQLFVTDQTCLDIGALVWYIYILNCIPVRNYGDHRN